MANKPLTRQRVLVAGGAGFIGSNLVRRLINRGFKVDCIDSLITGQRQNLVPFQSSQRFDFFPGDISDHDFMARFEGTPYVAIYNFACPTGVPNIEKLGEEMMLASSIGSHNLLALARSAGAKYLFASSAEAYGDPQVSPQPESYNGDVNSTGPRSAYEEGKRYGEAAAMMFARKYSLGARSIRVFNTYGVNMSLKETRVIPAMLRAMLEDKTVTIYGDGTNTRTFQYVDDLLAGIDACMTIECAGEVFNVGGERQTSVKDLFEACCKVTGYTRAPVFAPHFIEDHKQRLPDTSRIRSLGWLPTIGLETGLAICRDDIAFRLASQPSMSRPGTSVSSLQGKPFEHHVA